jgi:disulfide bond formation protein DsbB
MAPFRRAGLLAALAGALALATALLAEHGFGLRPCALCYWQRYAHGLGLGFGLLALFLPGGPLLAALAGLAHLGGGAVALFHAGVEWHWWPGLPGCSAPDLSGTLSLEALRDALLAAQPVRCDEAAWRFLGLSMAGYNFLYELTVALAILLVLKSRR